MEFVGRKNASQNFILIKLPINGTPPLLSNEQPQFVGQYDIISNRWGDLLCNKRYTPEFKRTVVETMREEHLSIREVMRRFEINDHGTIERWGRIYLEEEPEGLAVERRGQICKPWF